MRTIFTCMTAACALAAAAPAAAQYVNANANSMAQFENRIAQFESRIQAGINSGEISRSEAINLRADLRNLRQTYRVYARNGISQQERVALQARVRDLRNDLRMADGGRYGYGYGVNNNVYTGQRYDRDGDPDDDGMYDRYGNRIDVGAGVYAGQRYDRYGRPDSNGMYDRNGNRIDVGVYGQGGPYEPVDAYCVDRDRGGLGGLIDDIFGNDDNCDSYGYGLRVGSRATANLGGVPYELRGRYRDGNGVYYRSDGRYIYQIDARTNTVLRVYNR